MSEVFKPIYGAIWANAGEVLAPGNDKIATGWIQEMMPYQYENYLQNRTDVALSYLFQKGIAEWSADQEYTANKSVVTYGGQLYMATATVTNILPTVAASWKKLSATFGANGAIPIAFGGTGATTATDARTNLGIGSAATVDLPTTNGIVTKLANNSLVARTITGTAGYITVTNGDAVSGNPTITVGENVAKTDADAAWSIKTSIKIPSGTSSERGVGAPGRIRFNMESGVYEGYDNVGWNPIGSTGTLDVQNFSGDGVKTSFTMSSTPRAENNTQVYFNGVYQQKNSYNLVGSNLVFDEAPALGIEIEVVTVSSVAIGTTTAAQTSIVDSGNYYNSTNVEGALQQVGGMLNKAILSFPDFASAEAAATTLPDGQNVEAPDGQGVNSRFSVSGGELVYEGMESDAASTSFKRTDVSIAVRSVASKLDEFASVLDFGAIGDGQYHPLSERYATLALAQFAYANIADEIDSLGQSIDWVAIRSALKAKAGGTLFYPNLSFIVDRSIRVPAGTTQIGSGQWQYWNQTEQTGTTITTYGAGNPQRWTDIDGNDAATFKPLFVFEGDNCVVQGITPKTGVTGADAWSAAFYLPAISRTVLDECNADGCWTNGAIYVDGTWSDTNTTLKALHPYIDARACNELTVNGGLYRGRVSFCIQGTTRTAGSPWMWSPGGCSDIVLNSVALRPLNGSGFSGVPAAAAVRMSLRRDDAGTAGQGIWLNSCFIRTGSVPFMFDMDFIERVNVTGYGEADASAESRFSITSNTGTIDIDGRFLRAPIYKDGAAVIANGSAASLDSGTSANGNLTNLFVTHRGSRFAGTVVFGNGVRPVVPVGASLGTSTYGFDTAYVSNFRNAGGFAFKPNGAATYAELNRDRFYIAFGASPSPTIAADLNATDSTFNTNVIGRVIRPQLDNSFSIGTGTYRFTQLHAASNVIVTSDGNEKTAPKPIANALLDAWGEVQSYAWQWLASVAQKGVSARTHTGPIAQHVRDALVRHGIMGEGSTDSPWAGLCYNSWEDEYEDVWSERDAIQYSHDESGALIEEPIIERYNTGEKRLVMAAGHRWGIRAEQCLFLEAAYQRRRAERIEARLDALESR